MDNTFNNFRKKIMFLSRNRLIKNMSWLFILNFFNAFIPYFTFLYISRVLMPEGFGLISFALAFITYFITFIDYGFNLTGARNIAAVESDIKKVSKIYSSIIMTKLILFFVSVPVIVIFTFFSERLYAVKDIIFIFIILAFSYVIMPTWLFQGLQKVKNMTIISLIVRIIFLISIFILIKSPEDIEEYAFIYSISFMIISIISMVIVSRVLRIKFSKVKIIDIKDMLKDGYHVFTSSAVIKVMTTSGIFVLGLFHGPLQVGYYSGIIKLNQVVTMLFYPVGQALFPYYSKKFVESFNSGYSSVIKSFKIIVPIFLLIAMIMITFRMVIVRIVLGENFIEAANLLFILAFIPMLSVISNFMGTQILVASGHTKEYSRAFIRGALLSISLYLFLGYFFATWGVAIAALLGELISLLFLYIEIKKVKKVKNLFNKRDGFS